MVEVRCSLPDNEPLLKSVARLVFQQRFIATWCFLKVVRLVQSGKEDYQKDFQFIKFANRFCKKRLPKGFHDSFLDYVKSFGGKLDMFDSVIAPNWWKDKRVIEVGSGLGESAHQMAINGVKRIVGVEYSPLKVAWAQSYFLDKAPGNLDFSVGSVEELNFSNSEFDFAYSNSLLEHVAHPQKALKELYRVVKPGGELALTIDYYHAPAGDHLYDYIFFPWATTLVSEESLCRYWSDRLKEDQRSGKMGFYSSETHVRHLGEGSEIQLNKWNSDQMEQAMVEAGWSIAKKVPLFYLGGLPIIRSCKKLKYYLQGPCAYRLVKNIHR